MSANTDKHSTADTLAVLMTALTAEEGRNAARDLRHRREFWQRLSQPHTPGDLMYVHEQLAFAAVVALVEAGTLDATTIFDDDGFGFMDYVEKIAASLLKSLPKVERHELDYILDGEPEPEVEPTPAEQAAITAHEYAMETTFGMDIEPPTDQDGAE